MTTLISVALPAVATAAPLRATIGSVSLSPQNPRFDRPVTVTVSWCVPDGTKPGDTFDLVVPPQLSPLTSGFDLRDSAGDRVASATVAHNVVSVTTAKFVASHSNVCSEMMFPAGIVLDKVLVNKANRIVFHVGSTAFPVSMTPVEQAGASPDEAIMYGAWAKPTDQGREDATGALLWYLESPRAPAGGLHSVRFVELPAPHQTPDCAGMRVEVGTLDQFNHFVYVGQYPGVVHAACSSARAEIMIGPLEAGTVARGVFPTSTDSQQTSYGHTGSVSVDGKAPVPLTGEAVRRYGAEGTATGRVLAPASGTRSSAGAPSASTGLDGTDVGLLIAGIGLAVIAAVGAVVLSRRAKRADPAPAPAPAEPAETS